MAVFEPDLHLSCIPYIFSEWIHDNIDNFGNNYDQLDKCFKTDVISSYAIRKTTYPFTPKILLHKNLYRTNNKIFRHSFGYGHNYDQYPYTTVIYELNGNPVNKCGYDIQQIYDNLVLYSSLNGMLSCDVTVNSIIAVTYRCMQYVMSTVNVVQSIHSKSSCTEYIPLTASMSIDNISDYDNYISDDVVYAKNVQSLKDYILNHIKAINFTHVRFRNVNAQFTRSELYTMNVGVSSDTAVISSYSIPVAGQEEEEPVAGQEEEEEVAMWINVGGYAYISGNNTIAPSAMTMSYLGVLNETIMLSAVPLPSFEFKYWQSSNMRIISYDNPYNTQMKKEYVDNRLSAVFNYTGKIIGGLRKSIDAVITITPRISTDLSTTLSVFSRDAYGNTTGCLKTFTLEIPASSKGTRNLSVFLQDITYESYYLYGGSISSVPLSVLNVNQHMSALYAVYGFRIDDDMISSYSLRKSVWRESES